MNTALFPHPSDIVPRSVLALLFLTGTAYFSPSAAATNLEGVATEKPCGTATGHLAKAEESRKAAAAFRQVAARYRQELEKEKKGIAILPKATENPWWRKARLHYEPLIEDAERSAAEADRLAEYHLSRADELQGK
jgi:hypothetical protein